MRAVATRAKDAWRALDALRALYTQLFASAVRRGARLPPGDIGRAMFARFGDHRFYLDQYRRHGPVFRVVWSERLTVCVVGFKRAKQLFSLHARLLLPLTVNLEPFVPHGFIRGMSRDVHPKYRRIFLSALDDRLLDIWEADFRVKVRDEFGRLAAMQASGQTADAQELSLALDRIAGLGLLMLLYGLKPGHAVLEQLEQAYVRFGPAELEGNRLNPAQREAFDAICAIIREAAAALVANPDWADGDGALPRILAADPLAADETVVGNLAFMGAQGRYDLCGLSHWIVKYLSGAPAVIADLRAAMESGDRVEVRARAEHVVLETLRLDQAESLNRQVLEDFEFEGHHIPKDSFLRVLLRESHQDPATFDEPATFKPCRFAGRTYSSDVYAPFGVGEHRCLGGTIAVRLASILVEELVAGFTWTAHGDGERVFGRYHWEPPPTLSLALRVAPVQVRP